MYTTKRYEKLKKEFAHWFKLRQEALACEDGEKGKLLARNIDQGKLNKVYYDYFFEGLLKNLLTIYLPVIIMAAYVNEAYQPNRLMAKFGEAYVFRIAGSDGETHNHRGPFLLRDHVAGNLFVLVSGRQGHRPEKNIRKTRKNKANGWAERYSLHGQLLAQEKISPANG